MSRIKGERATVSSRHLGHTGLSDEYWSKIESSLSFPHVSHLLDRCCARAFHKGLKIQEK
jgi:hypothetical protein